MRRLPWFLMLLLLCTRGCSCASQRSSDQGPGPGPTGPMVPASGWSIAPASVTVTIAPGVAGPPVTFTARTGDGTDVTAQAGWGVDDLSLGTMSGHTFTPSGQRGGTARVLATWRGQTSAATVQLRLSARVGDGCPGCPQLPDKGTPCADPARAPGIVYPPDAVLVPPNLSDMEVHFMPGAGNGLYEIGFQNDVTDVRVMTRCNAVQDSRKLDTGGCAYELSPQVWDWVAQSNRGGHSVLITVRGSDDGLSCVAASPARALRFSGGDIVGGLYYWQSVTLGGTPGQTGGIFRYDFGKRNQPVDPFLPASESRCVGCHFLSRDGQKMTYGADDADADDEYGDISSELIDVGTKQVASGGTARSPGFQTFSPDHKLILASDGLGLNKPPAFFLFDGDTYALASPAKVPSGGQRGTQPDWSPDGKSIVFVQPAKVLSGGFGSHDDSHFIGGGLFTLSYDPRAQAFGAAQPLLQSQGENNYYPQFSPDSQYVVFNRAPGGGMDAAQDAFHNPNARVMLISLRPGARPLPLNNLNLNGALTNSWPRWSPVVDTYQGHKLAWLTFSSTRDYGLRVRNSVQVKDNSGKVVDQHNCYPPETPQNPGGDYNALGPECHQPQLWMAAIDLTLADQNVDTGTGDPSYPAFWLPGQDVSANNHIAQWVAKVVNNPPPDGGTCVPEGGMCGGGAAICCGSLVCISGQCGLP